MSNTVEKKNRQAKFQKNQDDIREQCQELVLGLLKNANKKLKEAKDDADLVQLMGVLDKGSRFLAIDNKIDEGDYGEGLDEL